MAFVLSTEIMVGQVRRASTVPTAPVTLSGTVATPVPTDVPMDVPVIEPGAVTASTVPTAPARRAQTVASGRARGRASGRRAQAPAPERVFAAELERGEMPSLREVKRRARCGTDRAKVILADLQTAVSGQEVTADV